MVHFNKKIAALQARIKDLEANKEIFSAVQPIL
jgi:hypothetical protein